MKTRQIVSESGKKHVEWFFYVWHTWADTTLVVGGQTSGITSPCIIYRKQNTITLFLLHLLSQSNCQLVNSESPAIVVPVNFKHFPRVQAAESIQTNNDYVFYYLNIFCISLQQYSCK